MYSDPRVADYITGRFVPVRVHVKDQRDEYKRLSSEFGAQWTPTILIIDGGEERHRIEGFLPADDFLSQLMLGTARSAFERGEFAGAERLYREVVTQFPASEAAAESLYWAGVSKYRATNDPNALKETARAFEERYRSTSWAKKSSVWR